jgi:hypothetical protein
VTGALVRVGGPPPGAAVPLTGQVSAISSSGARYAVTVGKSGRYRLSLPPGTYRLTGRSPMVHVNGAEMQCNGVRAVHVTARADSSGLNVVCSIR